MNSIALIFLSILSTSALAHDVYVHGYSRSNGTYIPPYHRSSPDNTLNNNYDTRGNVNPYTGQPGTRSPNPSYNSPSQNNNSSGLQWNN